VEAEAVSRVWRSISLDNLLIGQLAIFRADANRSIGGGHIMRCLALADALVERGWRCAFAVSAETMATVPHLKRAQHDIHILSAVEEGDPAALLSTATEGCQLLVIDHYGLGAPYEAGCRSLTRQILVIDDLADRAHDCDLLLDQNLGRDPLDYDGLVPASARVLTGPQFALLRPEFAAARSAGLARRQPGTRVRRILVTLGLTDLGGITARVVRAALAADTGAMLDVVIDERAQSLPYLRSVESSSVTLHFDPNNMCQLMTEADLAMGAAGSTSWERCCVGLPTILLVLADNQRFVARSLAKAGAVKLLENTGDLELRLTAALRELSQSEALRLSLVRTSAQVTDGLGAKRLAERVTRQDQFLSA
jgi:UDP-2,4-diacetamido-2,4,6-trideoxy-beta-L-altropyranose hydrolase